MLPIRGTFQEEVLLLAGAVGHQNTIRDVWDGTVDLKQHGVHLQADPALMAQLNRCWTRPAFNFSRDTGEKLSLVASKFLWTGTSTGTRLCPLPSHPQWHHPSSFSFLHVLLWILLSNQTSIPARLRVSDRSRYLTNRQSSG